MKGRTLKTNFAINVFGAIVPLAIALVTVPIYLRHMGVARYGVLSLVWVLLGYFGFLDLGLSRAAANALARLRNAPREARARVLVTTLVLNIGLGLFGSLCLVVFGSYLLQHVLAVPAELKPEIAQAFPWIVALFPLALISGVGLGTLESREQFLLANVLQVSGTALGQILPVLAAVIASPSLVVVIPVAATVRALTTVAILAVVHRYERPLSLKHFDRSQATKLLHYGGWISVSAMIVPFLVSFDQLLIGSLLGVAAVTYYAVPMNLVSRSQIFPAALVRTLFPRLSSATQEEADKLAARSSLAMAYAYGAVCAPAVVITPLFFKYWIGPDFATAAAPVAEWLFLGTWLNATAYIPYSLIQSRGRPDVTGKYHLLQFLPFIGILWALTSAFGIVGAAIAYCVRCAFDGFCMYWLSGMARQELQRALVPMILVAAAAGLANLLVGNAFAEILTATCMFVVATALAFRASEDLRTAVQTWLAPLRRVDRGVAYFTVGSEKRE